MKFQATTLVIFELEKNSSLNYLNVPAI